MAPAPLPGRKKTFAERFPDPGERYRLTSEVWGPHTDTGRLAWGVFIFTDRPGQDPGENETVLA
jgi:hypothetical protein